MGCLTGFYLVLKGDWQSREIVPVVHEMFSYVSAFEGDIPAATPVECGNYLLKDLSAARDAARTYLDKTVRGIDDAHLIYPQ